MSCDKQSMAIERSIEIAFLQSQLPVLNYPLGCVLGIHTLAECRKVNILNVDLKKLLNFLLIALS